MSTLTDAIEEWQHAASQIQPPNDRQHSQGGLVGPAFFPEGFGLAVPTSTAKPLVMVIGHNFGSLAYRKKIVALAAGGEAKKATWRHLEALLSDAKLSIDERPVGIESCFMTNWFVGLLPGKKNVGTFVERTPDSAQIEYEHKCVELLKRQVSEIQPRLILWLGRDVVGRAFRLAEELHCWSWNCKTAPAWSWITDPTRVTGGGAVITLNSLTLKTSWPVITGGSPPPVLRTSRFSAHGQPGGLKPGESDVPALKYGDQKKRYRQSCLPSTRRPTGAPKFPNTVEAMTRTATLWGGRYNASCEKKKNSK